MAYRPGQRRFDLQDQHLSEIQHEVGDGRVSREGTHVRLGLPPVNDSRYHNAQIDDYASSGGPDFQWTPPLRLRARARFSHDAGGLRGTAGFGFWNDPFAMTGPHRWRLPRSLWFFFASPPTDLPLAYGLPGYGWKAATLDAHRWSAGALAPLAPALVPMMHVRALYDRLWPPLQRQLRIGESTISAQMDVWHEYEIHWGRTHTSFVVDGTAVLELAYAPGGPMGLVVWIDNQFMVATPQGRLRHGYLATDAQWLELEDLVVDSG